MRGRVIRWALPLVMVGVAGAGLAMAATASTQASSGTVRAVQSAKFGMVLVSSTGRTLYRYTVDSKGVNRCSSVAVCNKYWPALLVKPTVKPTAGTGADASLIGTIKAKNGMRQVTYAGFPLYTFAGDAKAGQTKGQGFDNTWYVVNTKGALVKHAVTSGGASATPPATSTGGTSTDPYNWG
jgi:predicted lipoprotein with Yx(FWY)xxD motif